jgi:peptidoglycan/LPS O-acetylase OafA/YrhL
MKCAFFVQSGFLLGLVIFKEGISMEKNKEEVVK